MWSGCVALALGETSSVKYLMLEAFSLQTQSTWDNSSGSRAGVNQQQCRLAISSTHKNTINTVCWLYKAMPPHLWKQKITALNCSKHLGEAVWYIQRKSSWLLKEFQRLCMETGWKRGKNPSSFKSILCPTAVNYFLLFQLDKTCPQEFVQCHQHCLRGFQAEVSLTAHEHQ